MKTIEKYRYLFLILIVGITTAIYSNHFDNAFHFDDSHTVVNNNYIRSLDNFSEFFTNCNTVSSLPRNQTYRPLFTLSLAIDYWIGGKTLQPWSFHLSMFSLFIAQLVLMFFLFRALSGNNFSWGVAASLFAVFWYAVHPVNAETINYVTSRSDSYSTLFLILGLVLYIKSRFARKFRIYLIPVIVSCLFKQTGIMFGPILFLYILLFELLPNRFSAFEAFASGKKALILSLPSLIVCGGMYALQDVMTSKTFVTGHHNWLDYLLTQPYVIVRYFALLFFPIDLSADTDWGILKSIGDDRFIFGVVFLLSITSLIVYYSLEKKNRPMSFGLAWFLIALIPSSSVIPLSEVTNDHRIFFPFVGLVFAVVWWVLQRLNPILEQTNKTSRMLIFGGLCVVFFSSYSYCTYQRNQVWDNGLSLWEDVVKKSPRNGRGLMNYGLALMGRGRYDDAEKAFDQAKTLLPCYSYLHVNYGVLMAATNRKNEAEAHYKRSISCDPVNPETYYFYGNFLFQNQRFAEAEKNLEECARLSPGHSGASYLLMKIYYTNSDWNKLEAICNNVLKILPNDSQATFYMQNLGNKLSSSELAKKRADENPSIENLLNLSLAYYNDKDFDSCISVCNMLLEQDPTNSSAYNNICAAYNQLGEWNKAIEACEKSLEIDSTSKLAKGNLDWAKSNLKTNN